MKSYVRKRKSVKNPRLKSQASDKKQKPLFVGLRLAFICFLLHLPDALPAGFSLTQALRRLPSYAGPPTVQALSGLSPRLPRFPEVPLLRYGYFRFRSVCLHVTGFIRCWVNSYF